MFIPFSPIILAKCVIIFHLSLDFPEIFRRFPLQKTHHLRPNHLTPLPFHPKNSTVWQLRARCYVDVDVYWPLWSNSWGIGGGLGDEKGYKKKQQFSSLETTKQNKTKKIHDLLKCLFVNITLSNIYTYIYILQYILYISCICDDASMKKKLYVL